MLKLNFQTLTKINPSHGLSNQELSSQKENLSHFLQNIHKKEQGFYTVIDDNKTVEEILEFKDSVKGKYEHIVVLGIGGSALGMIALQKALQHSFVMESSQSPKLHVMDNVDPEVISELDEHLNYSKTLFIPISKSGTTAEVMSQYFFFRSKCDGLGLKPQDHFVFVTDESKGFLNEIAQEEEIKTFVIPDNVGGRFSVQTPVGLLPAALIGLDIKKLLLGMQNMRDLFLSEEFEKNLPFQLASAQYLLGEKGKSIHVLWAYSQKLVYFVDWYRQLLAESIGKAENEKGEVVNIGLTPVGALGVTDQHSQAQLYNEGPNDKFLMFLEIEKFNKNLEIPHLYPENEQLAYLKNASFEKLMHVEKKGTQGALVKRDRPTMTISIDRLSEESIGELFMLFEGATAFLGELYQVNAFNQPGVELSKNLTRQMMLD